MAQHNARYIAALTRPVGGVKGWVKEGLTSLMDGYDAKYWQRLFAEEEKTAAGNAAEASSTEKKLGGEGDVVQ